MTTSADTLRDGALRRPKQQHQQQPIPHRQRNPSDQPARSLMAKKKTSPATTAVAGLPTGSGHSAQSPPSPSSSTASHPPSGTTAVESSDPKKVARRERNRLAASAFRNRKKERLEGLEGRLAGLQEENSGLKGEVARLMDVVGQLSQQARDRGLDVGPIATFVPPPPPPPLSPASASSSTVVRAYPPPPQPQPQPPLQQQQPPLQPSYGGYPHPPPPPPPSYQPYPAHGAGSYSQPVSYTQQAAGPIASGSYFPQQPASPNGRMEPPPPPLEAHMSYAPGTGQEPHHADSYFPTFHPAPPPASRRSVSPPPKIGKRKATDEPTSPGGSKADMSALRGGGGQVAAANHASKRRSNRTVSSGLATASPTLPSSTESSPATLPSGMDSSSSTGPQQAGGSRPPLPGPSSSSGVKEEPTDDTVRSLSPDTPTARSVVAPGQVGVKPGTVGGALAAQPIHVRRATQEGGPGQRNPVTGQVRQPVIISKSKAILILPSRSLSQRQRLSPLCHPFRRLRLDRQARPTRPLSRFRPPFSPLRPPPPGAPLHSHAATQSDRHRSRPSSTPTACRAPLRWASAEPSHSVRQAASAA